MTVAVLARRGSGEFRCPHPVAYGYDISNMLIVVSSSTNFIIYFFLRPHFRAALRDRITCSADDGAGGGGSLKSPSALWQVVPSPAQRNSSAGLKLNDLVDHVDHVSPAAGGTAGVPAVAVAVATPLLSAARPPSTQTTTSI